MPWFGLGQMRSGAELPQALPPCPNLLLCPCVSSQHRTRHREEPRVVGPGRGTGQELSHSRCWAQTLPGQGRWKNSPGSSARLPSAQSIPPASCSLSSLAAFLGNCCLCPRTGASPLRAPLPAQPSCTPGLAGVVFLFQEASPASCGLRFAPLPELAPRQSREQRVPPAGPPALTTVTLKT